MKSTNTKTTGRSKKASDALKTGTKQKSATRARSSVSKTTVTKTNARKASVKKNMPSEEQIRQKAHELYLARIARGESGNEADDWTKAIDLLRD